MMPAGKATTAKTPLFDRILKPERIVLANGHSVDRPRSRTPLIAVCLAVAVTVSVYATGFRLETIIRRADQLPVIFGQILTPNWSFIGARVIAPLIETVKMSVTGTVSGCVLALPMAVFASANINRNRFVLSVFRLALSVIRSVPTLVYASVLALVFTLGAFAGTVAITFFTLGIAAKMLYESIETIDMGPFEAMQSLGATNLQSFRAACWPQVLPVYLDTCLYCFELNIRASAILGYVGAGGIGVLISERTGLRKYHDVGAIVVALFLVVLVIDLVNGSLRNRLKRHQ